MSYIRPSFTPDCAQISGIVLIVEWADLEMVDLSKAATPEGRAELAPRVAEIMRTTGFMYIVNHGLTHAQVRMCGL